MRKGLRASHATLDTIPKLRALAATLLTTLDARALPLLAMVKPGRGPDRKRVATAVTIAEKLRA